VSLLTIERSGVRVEIDDTGGIQVTPRSDAVLGRVLDALRIPTSVRVKIHGDRCVVPWHQLDGRDGIEIFGQRHWVGRVDAIRRVLEGP